MHGENPKLWRIPEMGDLELVRAKYAAHRFPRHFHDEYAIGVITDGVKEMHYRGARHLLPRGTVCVILPDEVHTSEGFDKSGWMYRMIFPTPDLMMQISAKTAGKNGKLPFFRQTAIKDDQLFRLIYNLHCALEKSPRLSTELQSQIVYTFGELMCRHGDFNPKDRPSQLYSKQIKEVKKFIDEMFSENLTLKMLADMADLSPYYFQRLFKKQVGMTPHVYITHKRIEMAKSLLKNGRSIADVACRTGFVDQQHMTNRFKSLVGLTPGQYQL